MAKILQIETSTEICSVAISDDGVCIGQMLSDTPNSHTEMLTILIQQCMDEVRMSLNDLHAVALSSGPGSYTSLRVGASTAKGICYALDLPLIAIDSLKALAYGINLSEVAIDDVIVPMIDARRMEVYTTIYNKALQPLQQMEAMILDQDSLKQYTTRIHICGSGATKFHNFHGRSNLVLHHVTGNAQYLTIPAAEAYAKGQFSNMVSFTPEYLKAPNIIKSEKKYF